MKTNNSNLTWGYHLPGHRGQAVVTTLTLPPENPMFQTVDQNMPWSPAIVLAIVSIVLFPHSTKQGERKND